LNLNVQYDAGDKGAYRHYMQKEIYEQPLALKNTLEGRFSHGQINLSELGPRADDAVGEGSSMCRSLHAVRHTTLEWLLAIGSNLWPVCLATSR
jgi:glucosamine 6-phosphate synthetase-like amidotransferase/phosphosugar isomerase protein